LDSEHQEPLANKNNGTDPLASNEPLFDVQDTPRSGMHPIPANRVLDGTPTPKSVTIARQDATPPPPPKTNPSLRISAAKQTSPQRSGGPSPLVVGGLLIAAALITGLAAVLFFQPPAPAPVPTATRVVEVATQVPSATALPPTNTAQPATPVPVAVDAGVPADVLAELLSKPAVSEPPADGVFRRLSAFTVAPARSRNAPIQYAIQQGDTLDTIAKRFNISQDTIIWNNDIVYVNRLQVGDALTILPENGILYKTVDNETIQSIADKFKVSVYSIIDSDYNPLLQNARPDNVLPPGVSVMVVGATSTKKAVYWNPGITITKGSGGGGGAQVSGGTASFGGGPGSCGPQPNGGGTGAWAYPVSPSAYNVTRGFSAGHTGIDLSAPTGTAVFAADSGTVIFAGWSNWGYGYSIVLAHGQFLTLYGHLSAVSVSCGQRVSKGSTIGAVGSTGNSTGPHLHFEIRVGETPVDPRGYMSF